MTIENLEQDIQINIDTLSPKTTPKFLPVLLFAELWERFSYYGMRALLVLFLTSQLGFADVKAYAIYSLFAAIGYAGPIFGGILADKLLGFRNLVMIGGSIMVLGSSLMTLIVIDPELVFIGLAFIAVGTSLFKGNITNLLGACYAPNAEDRSNGFVLFYVAINLGAFISPILCGFIAHVYGWHYGFGVTAIGMATGLVAFFMFQDRLGNHGLSPRLDLMKKKILGLSPFGLVFIGACASAFAIAMMLKHSEMFANILLYFGVLILMAIGYISTQEGSESRKRILALMILLVFFTSFFALEMHLGSFINLFTERNVVKEVFGMEVPASVSQSINPFSIIVLGFIVGTWIKIDKKYSIATFAFGLATIAMCFFVLHFGCVNASADGKVDYLYLFVGISLMGVGEVCVSPFLLDQATLLAPERLKGFFMGVTMLSLSFANIIGLKVISFMAVPSVDGRVDILESLSIYKNGFWDIAMYNVYFVIAFLVFAPFIHSVVNKR